METRRILELLLAESYVSQADFDAASQFAKKDPEKTLQRLLMQNVINKNTIGQAVAESYKMRFVDIDALKIPAAVIQRLPEEVAKKYQALVVESDARSITIGVSQPLGDDARRAVEQAAGTKKIEYVYIEPNAYKKHLAAYRPQLETRFNTIIKEGTRVAPEIVQQIIEDALLLGSSDVHFEPNDTEVVIRFRIDGVLQEAGRIPKQFYDIIVNRIKIEASLRIDEHLASQDGSIHYRNGSTEADLRISIVPTMDGEKIVMRVLSQYVRDLTLTDLGLQSDDQTTLLAASQKPFGMILVTGPTGSGKTTTLYSLLKHVASAEVNVTTIEDPVEYRLPGINQIQVNQQTNLTFAKGLRSIARQDPDIILVGEIRDLETAEIAVNAALTGHLLLSTFHANDAASAIPRMLDMGIEPFLLASTLELIVAQRLVRKICENCKTSFEMQTKDLNKYWSDASKHFDTDAVTLYRGKGCEHCKQTGYSGRIGVYELISMTPELRDSIVANPSSTKIHELATKAGARSMFMDGLNKVTQGLTTVQELTRVVPAPEQNT